MTTSLQKETFTDKNSNLNHYVIKTYEEIPLHSSSLRFFYANLRSIRTSHKLDEIKCIIKAIQKTTHFLIFTETWITSESDAKLYDIPNYNHIYNYRKTGKGGGVSIYVHQSIKHELTEEYFENGNHYLWIYVQKLSLNIGAIYRPGETNINNFLKIYSSQLERRKRTLVFGDFNIDLLSKYNYTTTYVNEIKESGYKILNKIHRLYSTRETSTTNTILDHVCTNVNNHSFCLSIIDSSLSDHKQMYVEMSSLPPIVNKKIQYEALDYQNLYNMTKAAKYNHEENEYLYFERFILDIINKNKIKKTKYLNPPQKDWINKTIIESINYRNYLWQECKMYPNNEELQKKFTQETDKVNRQINIQKKNYYYTLFYNNYRRPKKMWETINNLAKNKIKDNCAPPKLIINTGQITEGNAICQHFNDFFIRVGQDLAHKIPNKYHTNTGNTLMYDSEHTHDIILNKFTPCTTSEVSKIIDNLNSNTSTGLDGISTKTIKCLKPIIIDRLTNCINLCLAQGIFPDTLKVAKVTPIHKSGVKTDPNNYRPVSVLPVLSKIFERIIYTRLSTYLNNKQVLIEQQYGFRPKSSTVTAVIDLVTKIKTHIDEKKIVLGIFIDIKKAFDTVSHHKLLQKLHNIGVRDTSLDMLSSYLKNRRQVVKINNFTSTSQIVTCGIPQGSIIGPLLFLIYINNINSIGLTGYLTLYADDTCLFYFGTSINDMLFNAQKDLDMLSEWLKYNLLTINTSKTSFMIFKAKNKPIGDLTPLTMNNDVIQRSHKEKYLGLWIDDKLTWKPHIEHIRAKLISLSGALHRIANCIPPKIRHLIYNSLVKSHLEHLIQIWGTATPTNINPLQRTQNKIIKTLFHYHHLTPTITLYKKTKLLNLKQLYEYFTCILVRKIITNSIQSNIKLYIKKNTHNLRNKNIIKLTKIRTNYGKKTILYEGAQLYNKLPNEIKECKNINIYKTKLKNYLCKKLP